MILYIIIILCFNPTRKLLVKTRGLLDVLPQSNYHYYNILQVVLLVRSRHRFQYSATHSFYLLYIFLPMEYFFKKLKNISLKCI